MFSAALPNRERLQSKKRAKYVQQNASQFYGQQFNERFLEGDDEFEPVTAASAREALGAARQSIGDGSDDDDERERRLAMAKTGKTRGSSPPRGLTIARRGNRTLEEISSDEDEEGEEREEEEEEDNVNDTAMGTPERVNDGGVSQDPEVVADDPSSKKRTRRAVIDDDDDDDE